MKLCIFSDLHLHEWSNYSSLDNSGMNSRLIKQYLDVLYVIYYAQRNHILDIVFCGDLIHQRGRITPQIGWVLRNIVRELQSIKLHILIGNHDMQTEKIHGLEILKSCENVFVYDEPTLRLINQVPCYFIPYTTNKEKLTYDLKHADGLVFLHQGIADTPMGSGYVINEIFDPSMLPKSCYKAFTGHYHLNQDIDKTTVVGALTPQNWNDVNTEKGFLVYDTYTNLYEFIPSRHSPKFIEGDSDTIEDVTNNIIRINYTPDFEDIKQSFLEEGAVSVEMLPPVTKETLLLPNIQTYNFNDVINEILEKKKLDSLEFKKLGEQLMGRI